MKHILPKTKIGNWSVSIFAIFVILVLLTRFVAPRLVDTGASENVMFISLWRMFYYLVFIVGGTVATCHWRFLKIKSGSRFIL